jgi:hypothetical protein
MMDGRGFKKVGAAVMSHDNLIGKTWYDPASRTLVGDVKPDNFKKQPGGRIQALDLIVHRLPPESDIHDLLTGA